MLVIATNDDEGVLSVVDIIDADVPHALAVLLLLAEVHAEVEAVIHGHPEIVALDIADVGCADNAASILCIKGDRNTWIGLCGQGAAIAAADDP